VVGERWVRRWWAGEAGLPGRVASALAAPAEAGFRAAVRLRGLGFDRGWIGAEAVSVPVVSVGNLAIGGAGKTPFAAWLARCLAARGRRPAVVLRGYGADEAALHREWNPPVPVFTAPRRADGARAAIRAGCDVVVLDDGFQHRRLRRDLDVVLVAAEGWTPRPRLLPRGPWREPPRALSRADVVVVTRKTASASDAARVEGAIRAMHPALVLARCALHPARLVRIGGGERTGVEALRGRRVLAVAALAWPEPFLGHLHEAGAEVEAAVYPDHHPFDAGEAAEIARRSRGRAVVMTAKDAVKLRVLLPPESEAWVLEQELRMEAGEDTLAAALGRALREHGE
jgi:tetraacyldisaccharide 4'-kinase